MGQLHFSGNCKVINNDNRVILTNRSTGAWMKVSLQCLEILKIAIENKFTENQLIENLADEEDKQYFKILIKNLKELGVLTTTDQKNTFDRDIKHIYLALTHRCNLKCVHCCFDAGTAKGEDFLSTKEILGIIDKIVDCNPEIITFSGGEPLLRKDFIEILEYTAKKYNGKISLSTNATLLNKENIDVLCSLLYGIDISLDGVDEESCSLIRGPGIFDKVLNNVKILKGKNFKKISLSMVLIEKNKHLEESFLKLNKDLGTTPLVRSFTPIGRGKINKEDLKIEDLQLKQRKNFSLSDIRKIREGFKSCNCGAASSEILINYDGSIYPCGLLINPEYKLGNINDISNLKTFIKNTACKSSGFESLNKIQPDIFEKCKDCNVNLFCWNCLNDVDLIKNDEQAFAKRCLSKKKLLTEIVWGS